MNAKKNTAWIALIVIMFFIPTGCKKITDPLENLKLIIDYNLIKTTVDFHIKDAATGQYLGSEASNSALIIISGRDAQGIVDPIGAKLKDNSVKVNRGLASVGISPAPAYVPSETKPVQFSIVVIAPGYLTSTKQISITQTGRNFVEVILVKLDNTPNGVSAIQQPNAATLQNGTVVNSSTVVLPDAGVSLGIPQGLVMKDANGNMLQGGISVTMVHFDPTESQAINAFPGGMLPTVKRSNGAVQSGMFYTAGFVAIEITDQNGRVASSFVNGTLALTSEISSQVYNPNNNGPVAAGDQVGIWSLNENTSQWQEEGTATIYSEDGKLKVTANLSHLSYYAYNWFYNNICEQGRQFIFNVTPPLSGSFLVKANVYRQADNILLFRGLLWASNGEPVFITGLPQNTPIRIQWDTENSPFLSVSPESQNMLLNNPCDNTPVQVNLTVDNNQYSTITIQVSVYCPNQPELVIKPSFIAYCQSTSGGPIIPIEMFEGSAIVSGITLGEVYNVWVIYQGKEYNAEATPTQTSYSLIDLTLPADVCDEVFGSGN
jgi:hypothetical protein